MNSGRGNRSLRVFNAVASPPGSGLRNSARKPPGASYSQWPFLAPVTLHHVLKQSSAPAAPDSLARRGVKAKPSMSLLPPSRIHL
ncbi:MAG: hypothetical protein ACE5LC_10785, partial [Candidatus Aminicenantales bacterium]